MAAKPSDILIIKEDIREPDYSANYSDSIFSLLIKLQTFFSPSFLYSAPAGAGRGLQNPLLRGWQLAALDVFRSLTARVVMVVMMVMMMEMMME
jgi:hypothetical protein